MNVQEAIRTKRAIRKFTDESLRQEEINAILNAGRRAQSSKNSQPWQFIVIQKRETLQELATMGAGLGHVAGASLCIVILTPAENERSPRNYWHMFCDAGQSAAYMQLAAHQVNPTIVGIGSCLGTIYEPEATQALLGFPDDYQCRLLISFGYPAQQEPRPASAKGGRNPFSDVVHWERW